jgi:hypothetical protein
VIEGVEESVGVEHGIVPPAEVHPVRGLAVRLEELVPGRTRIPHLGGGPDTHFREHLADRLEDRAKLHGRAVEGHVHSAGVAGLGEELLGLLRVVRVRLHLGIVAEGLRLHGGGHRPPQPGHELLDHRLLVDRVVGGLADEPLVEGRHAHVELHGVDAKDGRRGDVGLGARLELGHEVGGDVPDDVHPARLDFRDLGRRLGDGAEDELLEGRAAAPVLIEGLEADELVALPLHEFPRARPDGRRRSEGLVPHRLHVLLGHDAEEDEPLEEERKGLVGDDVDGLRIDHADFLDGADVAVLGRFFLGVEDTIEGVLDVLRGHDLTVVEANPFADLELPLRVRQRLPRRGEGWLELELGVPVEQRVEHVDVDEHADALKVHVGVEGRRVGDEAHHERVLGLGVKGSG